MSKRTCSVDGCDGAAVKRGWCEMHYARWLRQGDVNWQPLTAEQRFWAKVEKTPMCWLWTGATARGYGVFTGEGGRRGKQEPAHRFSFRHEVGPISDGLVINHLCRVSLCVRPDHLEAVTQGENIAYSDRVLGIRSAATHCPQGHPYTGENLVVLKSGVRRCRTCSREQLAAHRRRKRAA